MSVIDIHPHIVSPDIKRYPLAPLGGTQSAWSSERPTTHEMLLKEKIPPEPFRAASPAFIRSMSWRPTR